MIDLLIIIVNWNGEKFIYECLKSVEKTIEKTNFNCRVIVIDNDSKDKSRGIIDRFSKFDKIYLNNNIGFAAANNIALRNYKSRFYLLLNPDTVIVDSDNFNKMIKFMEENQSVGVSGCKLTNVDGSWQKSIGHYANLTSGFAEQTGLNHFAHNNNQIKKIGNYLSKIFKNSLSHFNQNNHIGNEILEVDFLWGAYLLIRKEVFTDIGFLDETFYIFGEESDFCKRAKKLNWSIKFVPFTQIIHLGGQAQKQVKNKIYFWHIAIYYWYFYKHSFWRYIIWICLTPIIQLFLLFDSIQKKDKILILIHKRFISLSLIHPLEIKKKLFEDWEEINSLPE